MPAVTGVVVGRHLHREDGDHWPCSRCGREVKVNTKRMDEKGVQRWEFECTDCVQVETWDDVKARRLEQNKAYKAKKRAEAKAAREAVA